MRSETPLPVSAGNSAGAGDSNRMAFRPYDTALTEAPMFYMVLSGLLCGVGNTVVSMLYKIRWMLSYPLRTRIVPSWIPYPTHASHPGCWGWFVSTSVAPVLQFTVGELLLMTPILLWFVQSYYFSFVDASTLSSGYIASYVLFVTYVSANKSNSLFAFLFGIPFERIIPFHRISSLFAVVMSIFHARVSYQASGSSQIVPFLHVDNFSITGTIALSLMMVLVGLSLYSAILRRFAYQLWLWTHIVAAIGVIVALFLHKVDAILYVAIWWAIDLVVRYGIMTTCQYRLPSGVHIRRIAQPDRENPSHEPSVEIVFPKPDGFEYSPGQFVKIAIPAISIFEFHPVSISSAPHEPYVTMHLRERGDWTSALVALCDKVTTTPMWIEGPYGSLSVDLNDAERYQVVLLVSGGIGVTPCQSIGKSILFQHFHQDRPLKHMKFVWAVRDMHIVNDIPVLGGKDAVQDSSDVQIDIYCSRIHSVSDIEIPTTLNRSLPVNSNIRCGERPDLEAIFSELKKKALDLGEQSVAVFGCGPPSLMQDLNEMCRKYSASSISPSCCSANDIGVYFDLHTETFEF
jgi:predicted ferric reductase